MLQDREGGVYKILVHEMDRITAPHYFQDVTKVGELFPAINVADVARPVGEVDLLLGIKHAELHPVPVEVAGSLRLLSSRFGTGLLLDGFHPLIHATTKTQVSSQANQISRMKMGDQIFLDAPRRTHHTSRIPSKKTEKTFSFAECEEMGVGR